MKPKPVSLVIVEEFIGRVAQIRGLNVQGVATIVAVSTAHVLIECDQKISRMEPVHLEVHEGDEFLCCAGRVLHQEEERILLRVDDVISSPSRRWHALLQRIDRTQRPEVS